MVGLKNEMMSFDKGEFFMETMRAKIKEVPTIINAVSATSGKQGLNLVILEEKVSHLIEMLKLVREENISLKEKNNDLQAQHKAVEGSLVSETKDLEELSQEKMMTKMVVDNLLQSIDKLIETQEK